MVTPVKPQKVKPEGGDDAAQSDGGEAPEMDPEHEEDPEEEKKKWAPVF